MGALCKHQPAESATLSNVTDTRTDGQITLSWTPNPWTTGYEIDCAVLGSSYTRCATLSNQDHSATEHSVTISTWTAGGTNYAIDDSSIYDIRICSTKRMGVRAAISRR